MTTPARARPKGSGTQNGETAPQGLPMAPPSRRPDTQATVPNVKESSEVNQQSTRKEEMTEASRVLQPTQKKIQEAMCSEDDSQGSQHASEDESESGSNDNATKRHSNFQAPAQLDRVKDKDSGISPHTIIAGDNPTASPATTTKRKALDDDERRHKKKFTASTIIDVQMATLELQHERELFSQKHRAESAMSEERHKTRVFDFVKEMHIKMFEWNPALYLEHVGPSMAGRMGTALRDPHGSE